MFRVGKWAVGSQSLFSFSSHTHTKINETSIYGYKSPRYINCSVRLGKQEDPNSRSCPTAVGLKGLLTQLNHLIRYLLEQSSGLFVMTCCVQWNYSREIIDIHKQTTQTCYLRWIFKHSGCQNDSVVCALVCLRLLYVCLCVWGRVQILTDGGGDSLPIRGVFSQRGFWKFAFWVLEMRHTLFTKIQNLPALMLLIHF